MLSHTIEAKEFGIPDTYHFQNLLCRARNLVAKFQYFLLFSRQVYEDHIPDGRHSYPSFQCPDARYSQQETADGNDGNRRLG